MIENHLAAILTTGGKPSTWLPPGGCRADTWIKKRNLRRPMKTVKRTKQTEDDTALKESKKKERNKQTNKNKGDNGGRVDDRRTTQDIQESRWTIRSQSECIKRKKKLDRRTQTWQKIALFFFLARFGFISPHVLLYASLYFCFCLMCSRIVGAILVYVSLLM